MEKLYEKPDIYDLSFTEKMNEALKKHYIKMFEGCEISSVLDCSFGTGNLTLAFAVSLSLEMLRCNGNIGGGFEVRGEYTYDF